MLPMINNTNIQDSSVTKNIVASFTGDIAGLKTEIRMAKREEDNGLLPYYEAALVILEKTN